MDNIWNGDPMRRKVETRGNRKRHNNSIKEVKKLEERNEGIIKKA